MNEIRVILDQADYRRLVRGEIVEKETPEGRVKIALSDIGWDVMADEIYQAASDAEKRG